MISDYKLVLSRRAVKFIKSQDKGTQQRIGKAMEGLLHKPPLGDIKPLKGYSDFFRLRMGSVRILFGIDHKDKVVKVDLIGNRGDIYK